MDKRVSLISWTWFNFLLSSRTYVPWVMTMDLTRRIERYVREELGWEQPHDIDLDTMATKMNVAVIPNPYLSVCLRTTFDLQLVLIDITKPKWQRHISLAHELAHRWLHTGCQLWMSKLSRDLQEWQARRLAYHLLAPDYMLSCRLEMSVWELSDEFGMPVTWIRQRMDLYWAKHSLHGGI